MKNVIDSPPDESMFRKKESEPKMADNALRSDTECHPEEESESAMVNSALQRERTCSSVWKNSR